MRYLFLPRWPCPKWRKPIPWCLVSSAEGTDPVVQEGLSLSAIYSGERVGGAELAIFGSAGVFGLEVGLGYERITRTGNDEAAHSVAVTVAARLSAVALFNRRRRHIREALRWIDVYASVGLSGGFMEGLSGSEGYGSAWIGAGVDLRLGFEGWLAIPTLRFQFRYDATRSPEDTPASSLLMGAAVVRFGEHS